MKAIKTEIELKECPFCAGKPELVDFGGGYYYVHCFNCGITQSTMVNEPDIAVMLWNKRATTDNSAVECEECKFYDRKEWEEPCVKCERACLDYFSRK